MTKTNDFTLGYWDGAGWRKPKKRKTKKKVKRIRRRKSTDYNLGFSVALSDRII